VGLATRARREKINLLFDFHLRAFAVEILGEDVERHILPLRQAIHHAVVRLSEHCLHLKRELHRLRLALILHGLGCRRNGFSGDDSRHDC
jgi:hypothetical protein